MFSLTASSFLYALGNPILPVERRSHAAALGILSALFFLSCVVAWIVGKKKRVWIGVAVTSWLASWIAPAMIEIHYLFADPPEFVVRVGSFISVGLHLCSFGCLVCALRESQRHGRR